MGVAAVCLPPSIRGSVAAALSPRKLAAPGVFLWGGGAGRGSVRSSGLVIFAGDMCVGENTSRLANVRIVRRRRTMSALPRAAALSNESPVKRVSFESVSKILF